MSVVTEARSGFQYKAATVGQTVAVSADEGIVTALVSVTGIKDNVGDVILPGAYRESLASGRRPKVVWSHSLTEPVGRVLHLEELMPGDSRLPAETKDGRPWPVEAGALLAEMQFNLTSDTGRRAFSDVKFYSESREAEYSIGYKVPEGAATRDARRGIRYLKALDVYEISPVLFGAASETMTLAVKSDGGVDEARLCADAEPEIDWDEVDLAAAIVDLHDQDDEPEPEGAVTAVKLDPELHRLGMDIVDEVKGRIAPSDLEWAPPDTLFGEKAEGGADRDRGNAERLRRYWQHEAGIPWGTPGDFMACVRKVGKHMTSERAKGYCALRHREMTGEWPGRNTHGGKKNYAVPDEFKAESDNDDFNSKHPRGKAGTSQGGRFVKKGSGTTESDGSAGKDANGDGLPDNWLQQLMAIDPKLAASNAKTGEKAAKARKAAAARASRDKAKKGREAQRAARARASDAERAERNAEMDRRDRIEEKFDEVRDAEMGRRDAFDERTAAITDSKTRNAERAGEKARRATWDTSWRKQRAAERSRRRAWESAHRKRAGGGTKGLLVDDPDLGHSYFPGGDELGCGGCDLLADADVHTDPAQVRAAMGWSEERAWLATPRNSLAEFGDVTGTKLLVWDPRAEVGNKAAYLEVKRVDGSTPMEDAAHFPGTLEEHREAVRQAVSEALRGEEGTDGRYEWDCVTLLGTWTDRVVARRSKYSEDRHEEYEVPYELGPGGTVELGEPQRVELEVTVQPSMDSTVHNGAPEPNAMRVADTIDDAAYAVKALLPGMETKQGRVLSARNETRLRQAVTELIAVLEANGVTIDRPSDKQVRDANDDRVEPVVHPDTTSDGAREGKALPAGTVMLSPADVAAGWSIMAGLR